MAGRTRRRVTVHQSTGGKRRRTHSRLSDLEEARHATVFDGTPLTLWLPLGKKHPLVNRTGQSAGADAERAHPLTASLRVDQPWTGDNQPDPGLGCAPYVAPHAIRTVTPVEPRPALSVGPGGMEHGPYTGALALLHCSVDGHCEPVSRQLEPPA